MPQLRSDMGTCFQVSEEVLKKNKKSTCQGQCESYEFNHQWTTWIDHVHFLVGVRGGWTITCQHWV